MADHRNLSEFSDAIEELRRLAREPHEASQELQRLRHRIASERARAHQNILDRVAEQAHIELKPIFEEAQRRNLAKRHYVTPILDRLKAQAVERAKAEKKRFHTIRADYIRGAIPLQQNPPQLKFHQPIASSGSAQPGQCNEIIGYVCTPPNYGNHEASADTGPDPVGIWLYPYIYSDSGDCDETIPGTTLHDLTYQMGPPATSFAVNSIRVDLIANGVGTSHLGDAPFLAESNPQYVHSFIDMDVLISQQVNGGWQPWPLLSDRVFIGNGDYSKQIRLVLSGQTYPAAIVIRDPNAGGGNILCHMQLTCSADTIGTDGRVGIDFRAPDLGVFVGGITLLGDFV